MNDKDAASRSVFLSSVLIHQLACNCTNVQDPQRMNPSDVDDWSRMSGFGFANYCV